MGRSCESVCKPFRSTEYVLCINYSANVRSSSRTLLHGVGILYKKGKAVPLQARRGPEGSKKLRFPDFVTTAQVGGRLPALRTGRLYPQEIPLVLISVRG